MQQRRGEGRRWEGRKRKGMWGGVGGEGRDRYIKRADLSPFVWFYC